MVISRAFFTISFAGGAAHAQVAASVRIEAAQRIHLFVRLGISLDTANWIREQ
jgi:hypothetical protein